MIREAVERAFTVVTANFQTDFAALATAASLVAPTADLYKRRSAERFHAHTACGLGVYHEGGATSRRRPGAATGSGLRDSRPVIVLDFYLRDADEADAVELGELAIQALLRSVDEFPESPVWGAGDPRDSVTWEVIDTPLTEDRATAEFRALVRIPVMVRETGL